MNFVTKEIFMENPDFFPVKPMDYGEFLVISLGTGSSKTEEKFRAKDAAKWGVLGWLYNQGTSPLLEMFSQASADIVDIHLCVVFQALHSQKNYLRIQDDELTGRTSSTDYSSKENLLNLVEVGKNLLKKPVSRVNLDTGRYEACDGEGTNEDELSRFAQMLSEERRRRIARVADQH